MTPAEALEILRAVRAAATTREGRAEMRAIAVEIQRAIEEAAQADPLGASVNEALARARRSDRLARGRR